MSYQGFLVQDLYETHRGNVVPTKITSEELHNRNCFAYLKQLKTNEYIRLQLNRFDKSGNLGTQLKNLPDKPTPQGGYADLYTRFFSVVEENIEAIGRKAAFDTTNGIDKRDEQFKDFVRSIYVNNNDILKTTFNEIKHIAASQTPIGGSIEKKISSHVADPWRRNSKALTPAEAGNAYGRFTAMISANFKPQHTTSLATVRSYNYQEDEPNKNPVKEYRFGTQGQRHNGKARVSPLFEAWLKAEKPLTQQTTDQKKITHVYINNLGLDRGDMEGLKEKALSEQLHLLEERHNNIAVITLPADTGLMRGSDFKKTGDKLDLETVRKEFLNIALENGKAKTTKDFRISPAIRELLFTTDNQEATLNELLDKSFEAMGLAGAKTITTAQRQAVWFHFIKFELTNHILTTLKPKSVNFSCKDAIDRGGVSSAYYNLMKSINDGSPMIREDFDLALHAAPTMVKARGMNHHTKLIWNAVDAYLNKGDNYHKVMMDPKKAWLIEWRDLTCPHNRIEGLLKQRVGEGQLALMKWLKDPKNEAQHPKIQNGLDILSNIVGQIKIGVSGKRLLLEVATRTINITNPKAAKADIDTNAIRYSQLADKLSIKYPTLQVIVCAMKVALAPFAYLLSGGKTTWLNDGIASIHAAGNIEQRRELQKAMRNKFSFLKQDEPSRPAKNNDTNDPNQEDIGPLIKRPT